MPTDASLRARIRAARDDSTAEERTALLPELVEHLGDPDPELRDELVYSTLARWIVEGVLSDDEVRSLLRTCLDDDHLFDGIGSRGDDTVFTRSFSVLYVAAALHRHTRSPFLSAATIETVERQLLDYGRREIDRRGYVEGKGWAHAPAHLADALDELAACSAIEADGLSGVLEVISVHSRASDVGYVAGEPDRLATVVFRVADREGLTDPTLEAWVRSLGDVERTGDLPSEVHEVSNVTAVLSALYCRSAGGELAESVRETVLETRAEVSGFV